MVMDYKDTEKFKALAPILDDYIHWFGLVSFAVAYPEEEQAAVKTPESFDAWLESAQTKGGFNPSALRDLQAVYEQMTMDGRQILQTLSTGNKPNVKEFKDFRILYNSFLSRIRRLERDSAMEGSGVDEETGLRIPKAIEGDMKRELERLTRQGTSFCLTMFRVDGYDNLADKKAALALVVNNVKKCMRPFDDAYYMGHGHFVLNMKQTDIMGAEAGINRLRLYVEQDVDNIHKSTLSFCLVEPTVGDEAAEIILHMRQDLDENRNAKDAVLKFKEVSELERFLGTIEQN